MGHSISIEELYQLYLNAGQAVCTDTRKLIKGSVFFALKGASFNGNEFAQHALDSGCSLAVIDEARFLKNDKTVLVPDVLKALQILANHHRRQLKIPFLAITGSNAKTTHKELIYAVLSKKFKTLATFGNLNNHIGVPLTLLAIKAEHEFAIIEMGANHIGEIDELCRIAQPNYGLITNIGKAHLEGFGGIEGVKKGKSEMYRYLKETHGKVFINGDDEVLMDLAKDNDKISYGVKEINDIKGLDESSGKTISFKYRTRGEEKDWRAIPTIHTNMVGSYNFMNCLAAATVGNYFKVDEELIRQALEEYVPNMNRSQLVNTGKNIVVLDAYNANPDSMKAAIESFADFSAKKKIIVLGDMFELGTYSSGEHARIIDLLKEKKFEDVILVGNEFLKQTNNNFKKIKTTDECREFLKNLSLHNATILIKGSRGMKMETLLEVL